MDIKSFFNAFWAVGSKLLSGLKIVVIGIIVARLLGPEDFGAYSYAISFVTLLSVLAEFRLHNILIRELSEDVHEPQKVLGSAFGVCLIFSIVGYLILLVLARVIESDSKLYFLIIVYGISYFFQTLRFLRAFFIAKYLNRIIFQVEILVGSLVIGTAVILGIYAAEVQFFVFVRLLDLFLIAALLILFYQLKFSDLSHWRFKKQIALSLTKNSLPLVVSSFAMIIFQQLDKIMIKHFLDENAVGQYTASSSLISLIVFVPVVLTEVLSPYLIAFKQEKGLSYYQKKAQLFSDYIFWGSAIISGAIMLLSSIIINVIYGDQFSEAVEVMRIFSWQGALIAMGSVAAQIMIIDNTHQIAYLKSIMGGVMNILLNIIWIPKFGIIGAVWASLLAYFISSYAAHLLIKRYRYIFRVQTRSITHGLINIYYDLKNR